MQYTQAQIDKHRALAGYTRSTPVHSNYRTYLVLVLVAAAGGLATLARADCYPASGICTGVGGSTLSPSPTPTPAPTHCTTTWVGNTATTVCY